MEIVHEEEQGFFVLMRGEFIYVCMYVCVHAYTYTHIINRKLFFGLNQFEAGRTKFPYYK